MLFATLALERAPLHWSQLPYALSDWVQNAGGVSAFAIAIVLLARSAQRDASELNFWNFTQRLPSLLPFLKACVIGSGIGYLTLILLWTAKQLGIPGLARFLPGAVGTSTTIGDWILTLSGLLALLVVICPLAVDFLTRISFRRIWAIARLSWKEAIRGRVVWVFGSMALVFLFADWFVPAKAEDQLRSYVRVVYWSMTPLFLITAALLGSFSIPNDVKSNSIHTIVTKPVEKFEIVLGRFLGYAGLLTLGLLIVSGLSLIYVVRGVNEEAAKESLKARIPLYGNLRFVGTKSETEAENVGREWTKRSYITGPTKFKREGLRQYAVWDFAEIPASLRTQSEEIIFELGFDIFRLSKGDEEGKGVYCTFNFVYIRKGENLDPRRQAQELESKNDLLRKKREQQQGPLKKHRDEARTAINKRLAEKKKGQDPTNQKELDNAFEKEFAEVEDAFQQKLQKINIDLIDEYRIVEVPTEEITDYHTQQIAISAQEFQALIAEKPGEERLADPTRPALRVFVSVDLAKQAQMVGVSPADFYLVSSVKPFWQNFLKGVLGMWCTYMILLGVAIACSTYLSGVISLLLTLILYLAGLNVAFLRDIAEGKVEGGGPLEALTRLSTKTGPMVELERTPTVILMKGADSSFSWWIRLILNLIPDLNRHDLHQYVANGFDIAWFDVLLLDNFLPLAGYLGPWAILAYYLMKYREIANPQ